MTYFSTALGSFATVLTLRVRAQYCLIERKQPKTYSRNRPNGRVCTASGANLVPDGVEIFDEPVRLRGDTAMIDGRTDKGRLDGQDLSAGFGGG